MLFPKPRNARRKIMSSWEWVPVTCHSSEDARRPSLDSHATHSSLASSASAASTKVLANICVLSTLRPLALERNTRSQSADLPGSI